MEQLRKTYRIAVIIGVAMIGSLFIYSAIIEWMKTNYKPFQGFSGFPGLEMLRYLFLGIAVGEFALTKFVRNLILSGKGGRGEDSGAERPSPSAAFKLLTAAIINYALCETVAFFGLVLFFIGGSSFDFYFFMVLSLIFYAIYFPRYSHWEDWMRKTD